VQIYEDILGDANGKVTTGLLTGVCYLKDNRILPAGFDRRTTDNDIAVVGPARDDAGLRWRRPPHALFHACGQGEGTVRD
jgi:hypothetical protein